MVLVKKNIHLALFFSFIAGYLLSVHFVARGEAGDISDRVTLGFYGEDHVLVEDSQDQFNFFNSTGVFTVEFWFKTRDSSRQMLLSNSSWRRKGFSVELRHPRNVRLRLKCGEDQEGNALVTALTVGGIERERWAHIAFTGDGSRLYGYVNGELAGQTDIRTLASGDARADLRFAMSTHNTRHLAGEMAEVRIWDVQRSREEIQQHKLSSLIGDEEGLAGYWPMDEGRGTTVEDRSGGKNHGTLGGSPRWQFFSADLEHEVLRPGSTVTFGPLELREPRGELSYQWYFNDEPIESATEPTLTLTDVSQDDAGTYFVRADDEGEITPVTSRRVLLLEPDWPMWRFDAQRSADTPHELATELHLQWMRELPEPGRAWRFQRDDRGKLDFDVSYAPVVKGRSIYVPSSVTDSVTAYHIEDGRKLWRFHADGPVRLAPVAWGGRVYFASDDGHLYCVDDESGELIWKFRGGPSDHRLLGNERIINFWAARGCPVISDGTVYFTAGIWPQHGVFIYALDARSGELQWVNDTVSSDYVALPHGGAYGYGGLAPQGYIAVDEDQLVVAAGRSPNPVRVCRGTGEVLAYDFRGSKGAGGYAVHAGGLGKQRNEMLESRVDDLAKEIGGEVFYSLAARDRLFVTTEEGSLYCFGPDEVEARHYAYDPAPLRPETDGWADAAGYLLDRLGESEGYALMLGAGSGDLLRELIARSNLHVVVVDSDSASVRALRKELAESGKYGRSAAVIEADPGCFSVQPYLFSLVVSEDAEAAGLRAGEMTMSHVLDLLRPYGGLAWLGAEGEYLRVLEESAAEAAVDQVSAGARKGHLFAERGGPLSGAGQWTHQYHDAANTLLSRDERVRLPLGLLWFGGPSNHNILPRHSGGPRPQVAGGRQVHLGVETVGARCVYTGRQLWEREFPGIGHPFTNLDLEKRWAEGEQVYMTNIPGSTYIGSPFVTLRDSVYLRHGGTIYHLDPATGETKERYSAPGRSAERIYGEPQAPEWGHISVQGDYLIVTSEPHIFEDQELGWTGSYSGTSSRRLAVLRRRGGEILWELEAEVGFRHNAIVSTDGVVFLIDGLSDNARRHLARRGEEPEEASRILALDIASGEEVWSDESDVFGTFLLYSADHDILVEGGSQDLRRTLSDEPTGRRVARRGADGERLWESGGFTLPSAVWGDKLVPGRPGTLRSLLSGEEVARQEPHTGRSRSWNYERAYGCNTLNASKHLLFYRSGYAGFFDLEHDSGTGTFGGFRSGCTANMIPADGVLNALDYTRTCTCSYPHQTSLAMIHMPEDTNIEFWTRYAGAFRSPEGHGVNFGAPGRRVDVAGTGLIWHDEQGTLRRHPSSLFECEAGLGWVAASCREGGGTIEIGDLKDTTYKVRLLFAELQEDTAAGERVFDVLVDGAEVISGMDAVREAGGVLRSVVRELQVDVEGGVMAIKMRPSEGSALDPVINGIEILIMRDYDVE